MSKLVAPHGGGELAPLLAATNEHDNLRDKARGLRAVSMTSREVSDLLMLGMGAYTPLRGFMGEADWRGACADMRLSGGLFWPIPITLSCNAETASSLNAGDEVALTGGQDGELMGILMLEEKFTIDKGFECDNVYLTRDHNHPGVRSVMGQGEVNLAGPVVTLSEGPYPAAYSELYLRPSETRALFERKGWSRVAAFQTRNPMHRSHEYIAKVAIEICDGLLIHQVLGALKPGDIPAEVRVKAIDVLVRNYFAPDTCVQAGYPIEMRYAGPREALLHAVFRQNFGCSHLVVGRDHAGVGSYYGPFDSHHIFDGIGADTLAIQPIRFGAAFYSYRCQSIVTGRTSPVLDGDRLDISGTRLREMFANHESIPAEYSRPEVVEVLQAYYDGLG
jgi:sulfate adenylyltransferase